MTKEEILQSVKMGLKELSNYNDDEITLWINSAIKYLENAGVSSKKIDNGEALGVITLIVDKLRKRETDFGGILSFMITQLALAGD